MTSISSLCKVQEPHSPISSIGCAKGRYAVALLVSLATTTCAVATLLFVHFHASWVPFGDEYDIVPIVTGNQSLTLEWLWAPHNDHRIPLPRLVRWCLITAFGGDFRSCVYAIPVISGLGAVGAVFAITRIRGRSSLADLFFPLIILHWGQVENLIWGFDLANVLPAILSIGVLFLAAWRPGIPDARVCLTASIGLLAILLCGGGGLLLAGPMSLWLAWSNYQGLRASQRRSDTAIRVAAMVMVALTWGVTILYFRGLPRPPEVATAKTLFSNAQVAVAFLSTAFGLQFERFWWLTGGATLVALGVGTVFAMGLAWRSEAERFRALAVLTLIGGTLLMAAAIGHGRANTGINGGLQSRYATFLVPAWCALYLLASHLITSPRWVRFALVAAALVTQANAQFGLDYAKTFWTRRQEFVRDMEAGTPSFVLAEKYHRHPYGLYSPSPESLEQWFTMLRNSKAPHFANMAPSPSHRRIDLLKVKREEFTGEGKQRILRFVFPRPLNARLMSLRIGTRAGSDSNRIELRWRPSSGNTKIASGENYGFASHLEDAVHIIQSTPGQVRNHFVPIDNTIVELEIANCTQGAKLLIGQAALLAIDTELPTAKRSPAMSTAEAYQGAGQIPKRR